MQQPPNSYSQFQQPYNAPTSPYAPPPPPLQQGKRVRRPKSKKSLCAIGCGSFIGIVVLIALCSGIASSFGKTASVTTTNMPTPTPTATVVPAALATFMATETPVFAPTDTPTPVPTLKPTPKPQPPVHPTPTQPACQAVNNNPWCYNFSPGNLIYVPPSGFCNYFNCISTFYGSDDPGDGYIVECNDSTYSQSGGESGACSYHGGVMRPLYSH